MRTYRWTLVVLMALIISASPMASPRDASPTIHWLVTDFPPLFILSGPMKNQGLADIAHRVIQKHMPNFTHVFNQVPINFPRIEAKLRHNENYCFAGFIKTPEREKIFYFSEPYRVMLPIQLFVANDGIQPLAVNGEVNLDALLSAGYFRLGILGGRRYGPLIDGIISRHNEDLSLYQRYSPDQMRGLLDMLNHTSRSVDGVLAYPNEIAIHTNSQTHAGLNRYHIKGNAPYQLGYIACSRSATGRLVIEHINSILPALRTNVANAYMSQLEPEDRNTYIDTAKRVLNITLRPTK